MILTKSSPNERGHILRGEKSRYFTDTRVTCMGKRVEQPMSLRLPATRSGRGTAVSSAESADMSEETRRGARIHSGNWRCTAPWTTPRDLWVTIGNPSPSSLISVATSLGSECRFLVVDLSLASLCRSLRDRLPLSWTTSSPQYLSRDTLSETFSMAHHRPMCAF